MGRKRKNGRVYWRGKRAYGDFRDLGGKREPLRAPGEKLATTDPDIAASLASNRVKELEGQARRRTLLGIEKETTLAAFAAYHLEKKAKARKVSDNHLEESERRLETAISFLGGDRDLAGVGVQDVQNYLEWLLEQPNGRGGTYSGGTCRHYLNALSHLYTRAQSEGYVPPGYNPCAALMEKPVAAKEEARWLEVHEAALLLEAARTYEPEADAKAHPGIYAIIATYLLTGGRPAEVLGLAVDDVSFDRKTITFRPHPWRRLKNKKSHRTVRMWPQLEGILREYMYGRGTPRVSGLLFPARHDPSAMPSDIRKVLDAVATRAGWKEGEVRPKAFRHTYCAARLQTLDGGAPVSPFTVGRELGHGGSAMVERVYSHLGTVRHRSDVVEYPLTTIERIPDQRVRKGFEKRLKALGG